MISGASHREFKLRLHPLRTTERIRRTYIRYLNTLFSFQDIDLRNQFQEALEAKDMLVKGPILEATPRFEPGATTRSLVDEGLLDRGFVDLCSEHLPFDRPLYRHQEIAIRKSVAGRNVVIATGTGSGKTEGFLIPIFNHLLKERTQGSLRAPGIRCLLLYPMNALANDQLKRLRRILADFQEITFGRYTGETAQRKDRAEERFKKNYPNEPIIPNELHSREEMQVNPPHIFLTNYAMLEYLLLRPLDAPFFDGETAKHWRYIVLDEAHVYDGAQATEIGMLLRRLKDRVVYSEQGKLKVFATSATLGRGEEDFPKVASFATSIFGEPFVWDFEDPHQQDVVEAVRQPLRAEGESWGSLHPSAFGTLREWLLEDEKGDLDTDSLYDFLSEQDVPQQIIRGFRVALETKDAHRVQKALHTLLSGEGNFQSLQQLLDQSPSTLRDTAELLFRDHPERESIIVNLVALGVQARNSPDDLPLLPARYHLFARALEGAFLCLNEETHVQADDQDQAQRLFLRRHEICPHCGSPAFELANCSRCGLIYLVGQIQDGSQIRNIRGEQYRPDLTYLVHETATSDEFISQDTEFFVFDPDTIEQDDEDEYVLVAESLDRIDEYHVEAYSLCRLCGAIAASDQDDPGCSCPKDKWVTIYRVEQGRRKKHRCVGCGARGGGGVIHRFLTGQDAPVSVLAMELYQEIPPSLDDRLHEKPGQGRKLLVFTDSRQNAAFFAPYLERSYTRSLRRRMILKALLEVPIEDTGPLRIEDLIGRLMRMGEEMDFFSQEQSREERRKVVSTWLALEMGAIDRRISLEGTALVQFRLVKPRGWQAPAPLLDPPWNLSADEAWTLIEILLDTLRRQQVFSYPEGVDPKEEPEFAPRQRVFFMRGEDATPEAGVFGWIPKKGSNARFDYLIRLLEQSGQIPEETIEHEARKALDGLWKHLTSPESEVWKEHFPQEYLKSEGVVFRINHRMYELLPTEDPQKMWFICDRCGNITPTNIRGVCLTYRCKGRLEPLQEDNRHRWDNLYRRIYQELEPIPIRAEEHTAQLSSEAAAEIQDAFVRGEINALSCSTTFELGVDVGDLEAVLLRNMPPRTSNYVQRAGRAGRRTDSAAFSLTFAQRRSHDLTFYARPLEMVSGKIHPPGLSLHNRKIIRRHLHSIVFSAFFRWAFQGGNGKDYRYVGDFFLQPGSDISGTDGLREYISSRPEDLIEALERIIPIELQETFGFQDWAWVDELTNIDTGTLDLAEADVLRDLSELAELEKDAVEKSAYWDAERYKKIARNLKMRHLLGYLGTRNVLPKYGFPVDVVELKTSHLAHIPEALKIELNRDLLIAISEFAPGGQIVAAKKVWESGGLRTLPGRDLQEFEYAICPECNKFHHGQAELSPSCSCGAALDSGKMRRGRFVIPAYGFIAARQPTSPGDSRPQRIYSSRVYFADYERDIHGESGEPEFVIDKSLSTERIHVEKGYSRYGLLAAVNTGLGGRHFRICQSCGFAEPVTFPAKGKKSHTNPLTGKNCKGFWVTRDLGHRFMTDVLQIKATGNLASSASVHLWKSLLYALLEGASEALGIRRDDIDGTIQPIGYGIPPSIILFDCVPGGAGYVQRIYDQLAEVFLRAYDRVDRCECGKETSCYECLRNYYNQYYHNELQRGVVINFLGEVLQSAGILELEG